MNKYTDTNQPQINCDESMDDLSAIRHLIKANKTAKVMLSAEAEVRVGNWLDGIKCRKPANALSWIHINFTAIQGFKFSEGYEAKMAEYSDLPDYLKFDYDLVDYQVKDKSAEEVWDISSDKNSFQKIFLAFSLFYNRRADEGLVLLDEALAEIRTDLFKCGEYHSFYLMKNSVNELILCFSVVDIELTLRIIASFPMQEQIEYHSDFLAAYLAAIGDMASATKVLRYAVSGRAFLFPVNITKYSEISEKYDRHGVLAKINRHIEEYRELYKTNPRNNPDKAIADELKSIRGLTYSPSNISDEHYMPEALSKAEHSSSDEEKYALIEKYAEYANRSNWIVRVLKVYRRISDPGYKFVSALKIAEIMSTSGRRRSAKNFVGNAIGLIKKIEWQPAGILFLYEFRKAIERINDIELLLACINRHNGLQEELRSSLKYFIIDKDAESIRKILPLIKPGDSDIVNCYIENLLLAHLRSGETDIFNRIVTEVKDLGMEFMADEVTNIEKL